MIDLLRQSSRPYLFSNTLPPPVVAGASKVLDLLVGGSDLIEKLTENTRRFRQSMEEAGFKSKGKNCPIVPVMSEDARLATEFAANMLEKGMLLASAFLLY